MKKLLIIFTILILNISNSFSAGSSGGDSQPKLSNYKQAVKLIKSAKKKAKLKRQLKNIRKHKSCY